MPSNKELEKIIKQQSAQMQELEQRIESQMAKNNPVTVTKETDYPDDEADLGAVDFEHDISVVKNADTHEYRDKEAMLAFMAEELEIHTHDTAERNAERLFEVAVNGRKWFFERNKTYRVPRYVVETLARAKPVHYDNHEGIDQFGGPMATQYARSGLKYGFSVRRDSAKGEQWLNRVLREAS